ncbi:MAG: DUF481 domain-containing protein [Pirellulales bacterium]|nr:DUF481 domain-containing protein [Pirellulales bacterium]
MSERKTVRIHAILVIALIQAHCAVGMVRACECKAKKAAISSAKRLPSTDAKVVTSFRPLTSDALQSIAPLPPGEVEALLAPNPAFQQQDDSWKLPAPDVLGNWGEDVFPGLELPSLPELQELPPSPKQEPKPKIWSLRIEFGVNGAEGNSRFFNTRTGTKIKRTTKRHVLSIDWNHVLALNNQELSKNESTAEWRWETVIPDSDWSTFVHNTNEYDEFAGWDLRVQGDGGFSYWLMRSETTKVQARTGAGVSREFGGDNSDSIPEASAGLDFDHRLTRKQRLDAKVDYFPDVRNFNNFRTRMNTGWEIQIDEMDHLTLRLSMQDRYDSTPDKNKRPNDFTYAAQLIWDY